MKLKPLILLVLISLKLFSNEREKLIEFNKGINEHKKNINEIIYTKDITNKIESIQKYIEEFFKREKLLYSKKSIREVGFVGINQKIISIKLFPEKLSNINIIVPIKIKDKLYNTFGIPLVLEFLKEEIKRERQDEINNLVIYFIEDDNFESKYVFSSGLMIEDNQIENLNTIYIFLNENNNANLKILNSSTLKNSNTPIYWLDWVVKKLLNSGFKVEKTDPNNISNLTINNFNEIYRTYNIEEIPIIIINNLNNDAINKELLINEAFSSKFFSFLKAITNEKNITSPIKNIHYISFILPNKLLILDQVYLIILIYLLFNIALITAFFNLKKASIRLRNIIKNSNKLLETFFLMIICSFLIGIIVEKALKQSSLILNYINIILIFGMKFFATLLLYKLIIVYINKYKITLSLKEIKYLFLWLSIFELFTFLHINIELTLFVILKLFISLILSSKNNFMRKSLIYLIWLISLFQVIEIQKNIEIGDDFVLSFLISLPLYTLIVVSSNELLLSNILNFERETSRFKNLLIVNLVIIIFSYFLIKDLKKLKIIDIKEVIEYPNKVQKLNIQYFNKNPNEKGNITLKTSSFHASISKGEKTFERTFKDELINVKLSKTDGVKKAIYKIDITLREGLKNLKVSLENAGLLKIYSSNIAYERKTDEIIFDIGNIERDFYSIVFSMQTDFDIPFNITLSQRIDKDKIIVKPINEDEYNNLHISYLQEIKYFGILRKPKEQTHSTFFNLKDDVDFKTLKNLKL